MASTLEVINAARLAFSSNKPAATLYQTTTQAVATSTNTMVVWNSASGDIWAGWSSGSPTRWTVPVAGWYRLSTQCMWAGNSTGARHVEFYQNGAEIINSLSVWNASPGTQQFPQSANPVILSAAVGDYFQVNMWQSSGVSINTATVMSMAIEFAHF